MRPAGITALLMTLFIATAAFAEVDAQKAKDIQHLFEAMHVADRERQTLFLSMKMVVEVNRKLKPEIPANFWDESRKILTDEFESALEDLNKGKVLIYDHHYSDEEIKQLIAFYESPIGQKLVKEAPAIASETVAIGKAWGQEVGQRATVRLKELAKQKGYTI